ncbi:uncharacterized protein IL334_007513 [Kwoniella shivajii]|uniref:Uncharacterized protein n=1 Tax=Kwoniella shivajii TaxID=564305 RepID=A0ABZ1D9D8_9TREE|nr:hypothetical protein IL334_007513 [Kwoniella shivajii]
MNSLRSLKNFITGGVARNAIGPDSTDDSNHDDYSEFQPLVIRRIWAPAPNDDEDITKWDNQTRGSRIIDYLKLKFEDENDRDETLNADCHAMHQFFTQNRNSDQFLTRKTDEDVSTEISSFWKCKSSPRFVSHGESESQNKAEDQMETKVGVELEMNPSYKEWTDLRKDFKDSLNTTSKDQLSSFDFTLEMIASLGALDREEDHDQNELYIPITIEDYLHDQLMLMTKSTNDGCHTSINYEFVDPALADMKKHQKAANDIWARKRQALESLVEDGGDTRSRRGHE